MKKIITYFFILLFNVTAYAALPTGAGEFEVNVPLFNRAYDFGVRALFVKFSTSDLDYAVVFPDTLPPIEFGDPFNGRFRSARPSYDIGYEFYLTYYIPCSGNDLRLTYSELEQKESDHVGAPDGTLLPTIAASPFEGPIILPAISGSVVVSTGPGTTVTIPGTVFGGGPFTFTGTITEADVRNTIRQGYIDLDFGQNINFDNIIRFRMFTGLRYAHIKNQFTTRYLASNLVSIPTDIVGPFVDPGVFSIFAASTLALTSDSQVQEIVEQTSNFEGLGPKFGIDGTFHIGGGFGLTGNLSAALLVGRHQNALSDVINGTAGFTFNAIDVTSLDPAFPIVGVEDLDPDLGAVFMSSGLLENVSEGKTVRIVPNLQARIGLNYTYQFKNCKYLNLEVGYFINHYFNAIDRLSEQGILVPTTLPENTTDTSFSGPYLEVEFTL